MNDFGTLKSEDDLIVTCRQLTFLALTSVSDEYDRMKLTKSSLVSSMAGTKDFI